MANRRYTTTVGGVTTEGKPLSTFPEYRPYKPQYPTVDIPKMGPTKTQPFPGMQALPTYQPGGGQYPITESPQYKPIGEAYPTYQEPETGGMGEQLRETISARMRGEGTAGAESAIYERAEERMNREYEEGINRINEEMATRGLTGSGIHGEAIQKLEEERQRSMADLGRQVTIYGQQAIESAMGRGAQYVEAQAAEAARELQSREKGYQARVGEGVRSYEASARAAEAKGQSEQAAYQTAIAERIRAYESQARATQARNETSATKWQAEANVHMQKYQFELQRAGMLQQAKSAAWQAGRDEYTKAYESKYRATSDRWQAEQYANEAAQRKAEFEWQKAKDRLAAMRSDPYFWYKHREPSSSPGLPY